MGFLSDVSLPKLGRRNNQFKICELKKIALSHNPSITFVNAALFYTKNTLPFELKTIKFPMFFRHNKFLNIRWINYYSLHDLFGKEIPKLKNH